MMFHDRVGITSKRKLADGRLVVDARFARAGIYIYDGAEVGRPDMAQVRVYRPPSEVFDAESMASFGFKAVTDNHPPEMVTAENWRDYSRGITDGEIKRDGEFVRVPMMLADAGIVAKVDAGTVELSAGYGAELTFEVGITDGGEHYDAVMRNIRGNHIAVVDKGRAGAECRIADAIFEGADDMTVATKTITFDSLPVIVTDAAEAVIIKLQGLLKDAGTALENANKAHGEAIAAKDKELGEKAAEIADLKGKVVDAAGLDTLVTERTALLADAKLVVADLDPKGLDAAALRSAVVVKRLGDAAVKDKSADYVSALFDGLVARAKDAAGTGGGSGTGATTTGTVSLALAVGDTLPGGGQGGQGGGQVSAYDKMRANKSKAWETPGEEAKAA